MAAAELVLLLAACLLASAAASFAATAAAATAAVKVVNAAGSGPAKLCFHRIDTSGAYLDMVPHPAGGGLVLLAGQAGLVTLARLPKPGSGRKLAVVSTFLDLRSRVLDSGERGLLGIALHPQFGTNGRFFVSYICDANKHPDCKGPCACSTATGCTLGGAPGNPTCFSSTVVAEYWAGGHPLTANASTGAQIRRLLTFGRPYSNHNGGNILFGPDGYLYYTSGDGGFGGDPWNFAQKGNTFLGKILRLDVNRRPAGAPYGIPPSNPFINTSGVRPEIFALGLRNPWRCSFDRAQGDFWCGDVGQDLVEEVDRIVAGYNYGWHNFEGTRRYATGAGVTRPRAMLGRRLASPVFTYTHADVGGSAAVIGGRVYRAPRNACLQGKYLYNDAYAAMWVGSVYAPTNAPASTAKHFRPSAKRTPWACGVGSPAPCTATPAGFGGTMWSWAEDASGDTYLLTANGVYVITDSAKCGITC